MEEAVLETLISRGWRFRDPDEVRALIRSKLPPSSSPVDSVESELLNMDLRSLGGKSIDSSAIKKSSHLQGPMVLQLVSARDVSQSSIDASFKSSQRRLLRFILTDGRSEVTAVEYAFIPAITEGMLIPGTKVRLENKIVINSGILCLNSKVVTIMGGVVHSLYEEWQMNQKYSSISRSSLRPSQNGDVGPPPFEKLQIEARFCIKHAMRPDVIAHVDAGVEICKMQHGFVVHAGLSSGMNKIKSKGRDVLALDVNQEQRSVPLLHVFLYSIAMDS